MNFNGIARIYDQLAWLVFRRQLVAARFAHLPLLPAEQEVLVVGGGSGKLLEGLDKYCRPRQIHYLELSQEMIRLAEKRNQRLAEPLNVVWHNASWEALSEDYAWEMLSTCFVLDVWPEAEVKRALSALDQHLVPGGKWLYVDFRRAEQLKKRQRYLLRLMIWFFRFVAGIEAKEIQPVVQMLEEKGYEVEKRSLFQNGMVEAVLLKKVSSTRP